MRTASPIRLLTIASFATASFLCVPSFYAQAHLAPANSSTLPATAPTNNIPSPPPAPLTPAQSPPHRADITYGAGQITVSAANSSLNQILREISHLTNLKITGGVVDERVFGTYGPAPTSQILTTLLDGTGSNMVIVQGDDGKPAELILTPRMGGPTPPNPNAARVDDDEAPNRFNDRPQPPVESQSNPAPPNSTPQPIQPPDAADNSDKPANTPAASDSTQSPNGVKTPQQIFEELQRMRQQQQQQQSNPQ